RGGRGLEGGRARAAGARIGRPAAGDGARDDRARKGAGAAREGGRGRGRRGARVRRAAPAGSRALDDRARRRAGPDAGRRRRAPELLDAGTRESDVAGKLGMPPWLAKRIVAAAKKAGRHALEDAICVFAQLEVDFRGGSLRAAFALDEETALSVAIARSSGA